MRDWLGKLIVPFMKITGYRFSKKYRQAEEGWRLWVYSCINVVQANIDCEG